MKYEILTTGRFKKDLKVIMKRGYNIQLLQDLNNDSTYFHERLGYKKISLYIMRVNTLSIQNVIIIHY